MAREEKTEQGEMTVEQELRSLYKLQTLLSEIDKIKTLRGELPLEVQDLEDEIEGLHTRNSKLQDEIEACRQNAADNRGKIEKSQTLITKYQEQLDNVRNNREYDTLSKEVEYQTLEVQLAEKRINEANEKIAELQKDEEENNAKIGDLSQTLSQKKSELDGIIAETKAQEEELRSQALDLEETIEPRLLNAFKRIRKNSRNGLGIVYVQRDSCGGCFNKIPPQRQIDIRMRKKIIVCEYCGRILIDPELAGVTEEKEQEAKPKRKARKATTRTRSAATKATAKKADEPDVPEAEA
jgi:predicted  nucleic acid-binding Zn-ribbon protein